MRLTTVWLILQGTSALVLFALLLLLFRVRLAAKTTPDGTGVSAYDVLTNGTKVKALRSDSGFGVVASVIYVGVFYWALPVYIWRYGLRLTTWIVAGPIGIAAAISYAYNAMQEWQSQPQIEGLALLAIIPIRALFGMYVGYKDQALRRRILEQRGWAYVGTCNADSAQAAVAGLRPIRHSALREWLSRRWNR